MVQPNPDDIATLFAAPPQRVIETHISRIYLTADRAFKLKKAVRLPYVDFSTLESRRIACEREVVLNRRTAPQLYLGCRAVYRGRTGALSFEGEGAPVEWLVEMRRFDPEQTLDRLLARDALTPALVEAAAAEIAKFHDAAVTVEAEADDALSRVLNLNEESFARRVPGILPETDLADLLAQQRKACAELGPRLIRRRSAGRMRHCHGDLHLRNIVPLDDTPVLFDCLEFDEDMAAIDTLYDMAFLLMDLAAAGRQDLANAALNRYLEISGDDDGMALLPLYVSVRAAIRCHIAAMRPEDAEAAKRYLALSRAALQATAPRLIAVGGLSGTGKTTLARRLAPGLVPPCGAVILRSDTIRKRLLGVPVEQRLPPESYTPENSRRVYAAMQARGRCLLEAGATVILDAVFGRPEERAAAVALAEGAHCPFHGLWLSAPAATLEARVASRRDDASDATVDVVRWQTQALQAAQDWTVIDTAAGIDSSLRQADAALPTSA